MGRAFYDKVEDWAAGVITSLEADSLPPTASPRAHNSALSSAGADRASVMKRKGLRTINTTPVSSSPAILGQKEFKLESGGGVTLYHLLVSNNGRLDKVNNDNTVSAADAVTPAPFTSGDKYPDFAVANQLCFIANGTDQKKFDGTTVYKWGIARPGAAPTLTQVVGGGAMPAATYQALITYYNSATDTESSASDTSSSVTINLNDRLTVTWSASADAQVTHVNVYLRRTDTQPYFYRATQVAIGATTTTLNVNPANLTVRAPSTTENDPPPATTKYCAYHYERMFISDGENIGYSPLGKPENFNPLDLVPLNGPYRVTTLFSYFGALIVGTENALFALVGDDPNTWTLEQLDPAVGISSHRSVTIADGVARWWSRQGPTMMRGIQPPQLFGLPMIRTTLGSDNLNYAEFDHVVSAVDLTQERILFGLPGTGLTRNTIILPFHYRLNVWESDRWESIDAASLATVEDSQGTPWVYLGSYSGQVFRWWDATNDGVAAGTTMEGFVTSSGNNTLTVSGAGWTTNALVDRYVLVLDPAGTSEQRRRITANTATELTLATNWDTNPSSSWEFVIGAIDFQFDTKWVDGEVPFERKRYQFLYLLAGSTSTTALIDVQLFLDYEEDSARHFEDVDVGSGGVVWGDGTDPDEAAEEGEGVWNTSRWSSAAARMVRKRVAKKGRLWRVRVRNYEPDEEIVLHKIAMRGESLTDKNAA
jgi:hypothetical protein